MSDLVSKCTLNTCSINKNSLDKSENSVFVKDEGNLSSNGNLGSESATAKVDLSSNASGKNGDKRKRSSLDTDAKEGQERESSKPHKDLFALIDSVRRDFNHDITIAILNELQRNPEAASHEYQFTRLRYCGSPPALYPLHQAIILDAPLKIVKALYDCYPPAIKSKNAWNGCTTLMSAITLEAPLEVVSFILEKWPDAIKVWNKRGQLPLHEACSLNEPLKLITLLLEKWPDAIQIVDNAGRTALDIIEERNDEFECSSVGMEEFGWSEDEELSELEPKEGVLETLTFLYHLYGNKTCDLGDKVTSGTLSKILWKFDLYTWWGGIKIAFDMHPTVIPALDIGTEVMPNFLSFVGGRCKLTTMWVVLKNQLDLVPCVE